MIRNTIRRLKNLLLKALNQGTTPRMLAITCSLGAVLAVFPVYGGTTLLCFLAAFLFRLNIVVIQAVNYALTPVQLLLIIPFMQSGVFIFNLKRIPLEYNEIFLRSKEDMYALLSELSGVIAGGIAVWVAFATPAFFLLFYIFHLLFVKASGPHAGNLTE
ncbi:MAG TPA: DUF2062 domain-containing protein [Cyclobacteriaceae bacterium]|nr:DUF2062 domain-containing protein [Cyclobacteriaceae bacterium]HRJ83624.1 DUF2062 domain-containing protein [Cyclobacteriaceae bacterium]